MKRISFLPLLALIIAVAASAFTIQRKASTQEHWFVYNGPDQSLAELQDAANYSSPDDTQPCTGSTAICGVYYQEDDLLSSRPEDFDEEMLGKIHAVALGTTQYDEIAQQP
ncbi:MAG TPA: hypothetical protein VMR70_16280 [Flavisolibacter sp.]|nr:hypothetical protein [Flavisolibacter sp.]